MSTFLQDKLHLEREILKKKNFIEKNRFRAETGDNCSRCRKPISIESWSDGTHPCIGIEREELGSLAREFEILLLKEADEQNRDELVKYIESCEWAEKRAQALVYYFHRCCSCGAQEDLDVYHLDTERLGCEMMSDLTVRCDSCHRLFHHETEQRIRSYLSERWQSARPDVQSEVRKDQLSIARERIKSDQFKDWVYSGSTPGEDDEALDKPDK